MDAKADLLVYGNGEAPLKEIVNLLNKGIAFQNIKNVKGTAVPVKQNDKLTIHKHIKLPSFEEVKDDKNKFLEMTKIISENLNPYHAQTLYQDSGTQGVLINPPALPLSTPDLDYIYDLPFTRLPHPKYKKSIPALFTVEHSITAHRGCYGGCNFCSIYFHQGKFIQNRSFASIQKEIEKLAQIKKKPIVITDLGGPTGNMYGTHCKDEKMKKSCKRSSCLYPEICTNLQTSMQPYLLLLEQVRKDPNVKNVFINSGIRMDLALCDIKFIETLAKYYTQGQLSTAPETCC